MKEEYYAVAVVLAVTTLLFVLIFRGYRKLKTPIRAPYVSKNSLLTPAEKNFYDVLRQVLGDNVAICPKPALREMLEVRGEIQKGRTGYFNRISQKNVDFVLCDKESMEILCAVELDDRSHLRKDRRERDEFVDKAFQTAGIMLFRIPCRRNYGVRELSGLCSFVEAENRKNIAQRARQKPPNCPKCGAPMVIRVAKQGEYRGQKFYGCSNFPNCREVIPLEEARR